MNYNVIEIFTSEEARWKSRPVYEAVIDAVQQARIAARCTVTRGVAGCYENGEVASDNIEILSFNMPLKIEIILPEAEVAAFLPQVEEMVTEGTVAVETMDLRSHKTRKYLVPRQIRVRDVMTSSPQTVAETTPVSDVIWLLLSADFNAVPVVDAANKPVGIITQGDLIRKVGMPIRLGLLSLAAKESIDQYLQNVSPRMAREIMTAPAVTIRDDQRLDEAVKVMFKHNLKRLPVVGADGVIAGILARYDVFHTITKESPNWKGLQERKVKVANVGTKNIRLSKSKTAHDVMKKEILTVREDTPVDEAVKLMAEKGIKRLPVIDENGVFKGMVSRDSLLRVGQS